MLALVVIVAFSLEVPVVIVCHVPDRVFGRVGRVVPGRIHAESPLVRVAAPIREWWVFVWLFDLEIDVRNRFFSGALKVVWHLLLGLLERN